MQQAEQGCLINNFVGLFDDTVYGQQWIDKRIGNALMQCECFWIWLWWWQVPHKSVWWCGGPPKWDPGQTCQEQWTQEEQEQLTCSGNSNLVTDSCQLHKQAGTRVSSNLHNRFYSGWWGKQWWSASSLESLLAQVPHTPRCTVHQGSGLFPRHKRTNVPFPFLLSWSDLANGLWHDKPRQVRCVQSPRHGGGKGVVQRHACLQTSPNKESVYVEVPWTVGSGEQEK